MSVVLGKNVMLYQFDAFWKPWACGTDCSLTTTKETVETSITGTGKWRTYEYAGGTWDISFDGLIFLQKVNTLALPDIRQFQDEDVKILVRYERIDEDGNVYQEEGIGLLVSITDSGSDGAPGTFSIKILGSGKLTRIFVPTPVNPNGKVKIIEHTAAVTETTYSSALLYLKDVLNVFIDGQARSKIITSGTPVNQEAKYTSAAGVGMITFAQPLEVDTELRIEYQDI